MKEKELSVAMAKAFIRLAGSSCHPAFLEMLLESAEFTARSTQNTIFDTGQGEDVPESQYLIMCAMVVPSFKQMFSGFTGPQALKVMEQEAEVMRHILGPANAEVWREFKLKNAIHIVENVKTIEPHHVLEQLEKDLATH